MGILPWSSTRGRLHPRGGHAGLSRPPADPTLDPELRDGWELVSTAATAGPTSAELAGLETALAQFRAAVPLSTIEAGQQRRGRMTPSTLGARLGIAAAGAMVLGFGGLSAAALTGSLPDAAQHVIRPVGGVPADDDTDTQTAGDTQDGTEVAGEDAGRTNPTGAPTSAPTTAVGPDATGPAAFGLCTAYTHGKADGKTADQSVAFRNLVTAAGGKDKVEAYCAAVKHPSAHATGKATHPSADDRAGSKPGSHPTGKPDSTTGNTHRATPHGKPSGTGTGTVAPRP